MIMKPWEFIEVTYLDRCDIAGAPYGAHGHLALIKLGQDIISTRDYVSVTSNMGNQSEVCTQPQVYNLHTHTPAYYVCSRVTYLHIYISSQS